MNQSATGPLHQDGKREETLCVIEENLCVIEELLQMYFNICILP